MSGHLHQEYESACSTLQAEMQRAAADEEAAHGNGQHGPAGARSGADTERSQKSPVLAPASSGISAVGIAPGQQQEVHGMSSLEKVRQSAGVDEGPPEDTAAVQQRKPWHQQPVPHDAANGSALVTPARRAAGPATAARGGTRAHAPARAAAAPRRPQVAAGGAADGGLHPMQEGRAVAASTDVQRRDVPNGTAHTAVSCSSEDALLEAMLSGPAGTPQQSPWKAPTLHKGTQAAGQHSGSRPGSPRHAAAAPQTTPETGARQQCMEVLVRNMQVDASPRRNV
jgi:hypothetical protein